MSDVDAEQPTCQDTWVTIVRTLAISCGLLLGACGSGGSDPAAVTDGGGDDAPIDAPIDARGDASGEVQGDASADTFVDGASAPAPAILSLNLHCLKTEGTTFATNAARFGAIADRAHADGVTAIAVQEACVRGDESAMDLLAAELKRATGVAWSSRWAFAHKAWEGTADEAEEGVGVFVRGTLSGDEVIIHRVQGSLVRVAVAANIGEGRRLYSVHFDHANAAVRAAQAREIAARALVDTDPGFGAIVAGDFNAKPGDEPHALMLSFGFRDLSTSLAATRIDHVFAHRAAGVAAGSARLIFDGADGPRVSDHPGVLLKLAPAPHETPLVTRVIGRAKLTAGQWLALRGATAPLSWSAGWPARETEAGWKVVLTELTGATGVEVKLLRDDVTWMTGPNATITPGTDTTLEPTF